jgi:betaine reductase
MPPTSSLHQESVYITHDGTWYAYQEDNMELQGKKVIALGERDGVQGHAIAQCATSAGAQVVLEMTHCFV